jgi:hypothetical protein
MKSYALSMKWLYFFIKISSGKNDDKPRESPRYRAQFIILKVLLRKFNRDRSQKNEVTVLREKKNST